MQIRKPRTPLHRLRNERTLSHLWRGESQWYFILFNPHSYPRRTRSFLSSTCRGAAPPLSPPPFLRSHQSSFPSAAWSWRARRLPDLVAVVDSSKGSDAQKRNRIGAVPRERVLDNGFADARGPAKRGCGLHWEQRRGHGRRPVARQQAGWGSLWEREQTTTAWIFTFASTVS
jgi:hypothetical protein